MCVYVGGWGGGMGVVGAKGGGRRGQLVKVSLM